MERYINCITHITSEGNLLIGSEAAALFDCGMLFCAKDTIAKIKSLLNGRPLNYIFATHTHYDHIGALPFLRDEWPEIQLVTSYAGAEVLLKNTPRRVIRELSLIAAEAHMDDFDPDKFIYNDDAFHTDITMKEGNRIDLGGITVEAIETPGHTRDSLSYFIRELELLIISETPGVLMTDGNIYPTYLTGYKDTLDSINKLRSVPYKYLSMPHRGITEEDESKTFFDKAAAVNEECYKFIFEMYMKGFDEKQMLEEFFHKYGTETILAVQPENAFILNAEATIKCTLKELKNMFEIKVLRADSTHTYIIETLAREIWSEHYTPIIGSRQVEYMLDKFQSRDSILRQMNQEGYSYYVAFAGEEPVGYCSVKWEEEQKTIFLSKLYVKNSYRKMGISKKMLQTVYAEYPCYQNIYLTVNKNNLNSIAAYKAMGFKIKDGVVNDIGNGFVMDDYIMII